MPSTQIRFRNLPNCPVCTAVGIVAYTNATDKLFGVPGTWDLSACSNKICGTYWLNPAPNTHELQRLYETYSTHSTPQQTSSKRDSFLNRVRHAVLFQSLNYQSTRSKSQNFLYNILSYIHPAWRDTQLANAFYVPAKQGGYLLDIGCGNGSSMLTMQARGWEVTGIDFDETAVAQAKNNGLDASTGDLFSVQYEDNYFDAIMMNHVIEHVSNPQELIKECLRILKPGGKLVALTPNITSKGHREFKEDWRGLEIPRHLQIFSPASLTILATKSGFKDVEAFTSTQGILQIYDESKTCHKTGTFIPSTTSHKNKYFYHVRWFIAGWRHILFPHLSEVAVLRCTK